MVKSESRTPCFLRIKCVDCENEQIAFSHASIESSCEVCGKTLVIPEGGKAEIDAEILEIVG